MVEPDVSEVLSRVIDFFSVPAFLLDLSENRVTACNSQLLRSYGINFSEMFDVEVRGVIPEKGDLVPLRLVQEAPEVVLEVTEEGQGAFEMCLVAGHIVLIVETGKDLLQRKLQPAAAPRGAFAKSTSFHFSYIHNLASGKWTFSHPELLVSLGLISEGDSAGELNWRSLIVEADLDFYDSMIKNAKEHGGNHEIHYQVQTHSGELVSVCDYCAVTTPDGKWPVLVGSVVSAERSFAEIEVAERQVLLGRLVGGMVHDFKNLLGGIQNIVEWAIFLNSENENPAMVDALRKTLRYTEQATGLISSTLKVMSGEKKSKTEQIDIGAVARDLEDLIKRVIPSSVDLKIQIESPLPVIYGQRGLLQDMLLNLCLNARDAMHEGGNLLTIKAYSTTVDDEHGNPQSFVALEVIDNGCGMTAEELERVFNAFHTTKSGGAGLGLWMVKEAVRSCDGHIDVKSSPGVGTTFRLLFPALEGEKVASAERHGSDRVERQVTPAPGYYSRTILLVEDDPLIRSGVSTWLDSLGFNLYVAADGNEGWELFKDHSSELDVVVQDYVLPGKLGDELLRDISRVRPELPVIVASANPDDEKMQKLQENGAFAFLAKPFRMEELLRLIDSALNSPRADR